MENFLSTSPPKSPSSPVGTALLSSVYLEKTTYQDFAATPQAFFMGENSLKIVVIFQINSSFKNPSTPFFSYIIKYKF